MFTSSDTNLLDLDFELLDETQQQQQQQNYHYPSSSFSSLSNGTMIKELLSSSSPSSSNYRVVKPVNNNNKRTSTAQLGRQLTDDGSSKQRTPPNSLGNSVSPLSSSFISRLSSSNESSPSRNGNINSTRFVTATNISPTTAIPSRKANDTVTSLLKQAIAPTQLIQAVQTRLENPTRYHLEQISRKQSLIAEETPAQILQHEESSPDSEFTSEMDDQLNDETTCGSVESNSRAINITTRRSNATPGEATTPIFLSSSLSKDSVDSFSNLSSSCPTNVLNAKAKIGLPLTEDEMKLVIRDRQKKDNHNMIERRRRFNINDRIKELGMLLPKGTDLDTKQNKGTILRASVDYIKILRRQYDNNVLIEEKCQTLNEENHALRERIRELERQCLTHGVAVSPSMIIQPTNSIKQEPSSLSSSLTNSALPLVPPSTPIFSKFDSFPTFDSLSNFPLVDEDSNETATASGHQTSNAHDDPLAFTTDPFLSSTSFGFDHEMDIGGVFP